MTEYIEPAEIRAGDSVEWYKSLSDYPASSWTLTYTLINSTSKITITGTAYGDIHAISVPTTATDDYAAGWYDWVAHVSAGASRFSVASGRMQVLPNLAAATTYDARTHARKMLDAIESLLEGRATGDEIDLLEASYDIRTIKRDPAKMMQIRDKYKAEVSAEAAAIAIKNGTSTGRTIRTRLK